MLYLRIAISFILLYNLRKVTLILQSYLIDDNNILLMNLKLLKDFLFKYFTNPYAVVVVVVVTVVVVFVVLKGTSSSKESSLLCSCNKTYSLELNPKRNTSLSNNS